MDFFQAFKSINMEIQGIPSTTNHLESIHGYINRITLKEFSIKMKKKWNFKDMKHSANKNSD